MANAGSSAAAGVVPGAWTGRTASVSHPGASNAVEWECGLGIIPDEDIGDVVRIEICGDHTQPPPPRIEFRLGRHVFKRSVAVSFFPCRMRCPSQTLRSFGPPAYTKISLNWHHGQLMSLSKERDKNPDALIEEAERRRWLRIVITLPLLFVFLVAVLVVALQFWRGDSESLLEMARQELKLANESEDPARKLQHAAAAEAAALKARNLETDVSTSNLLLAAAIALKQDDVQFSNQIGPELERAAQRVKLGECEAFDLWQAGEAFFYAGYNKRADWAVTEALSLGEYEKEVLRLAIQVRYDLGAENSALKLSEQLARLDPEDCLPWKAMSYVFEDRQTPEQLVNAYRELLKRNCDSPEETRLKMIEQLIDLGEADEAQSQWEQLISSDPKLAGQNRSTKAKLLFLQGKLDQTRVVLDEILQHNPEDFDALLLQGKILLTHDSASEAIESLETLIRLDPSNPEGYYVLGQAYAKIGRREEAEENLAIYEELSTALVELHRMERQAAIDINDPHIRRDIAARYEVLGLPELAEHWQNSADALQSN